MVLSCFTLLKAYNDSNTTPSISMECCEFILKEIRDKSVSIKIYIDIYNVYPSIYLSIYLSIHPSIYLSIYPSIHPSTHLQCIYSSIYPLYIIDYILQLVGETREHEPFINSEEDTPSNNVSLMKFLVFLMKEVSMCVFLLLILFLSTLSEFF